MNELERQKLEALKELAYGASHEINNPLANIAARAQALLRDETHPERRRTLQAIHQQALRAHEMISDLMLFARPPQLQVEEVVLEDLLQDVGNTVRDEGGATEIRVEVSVPDVPVQATVDPVQLAVALKAVCLNAVEAMGHEGTLRLALHSRVDRTVRITVSDTGPGVPPEVRAHMFDPFYSGREAGRGLGFGLPKCWRIVTEHGGDMHVDSLPGQGTTVTLELPASRPEG